MTSYAVVSCIRQGQDVCACASVILILTGSSMHIDFNAVGVHFLPVQHASFGVVTNLFFPTPVGNFLRVLRWLHLMLVLSNASLK